MNDNKNSAYLVSCVDLGFFESTARRYMEGALIIKGGNFSACNPSFHLLSSLAFELFPKVLLGYDICLKYKNSIDISQEDIVKEISEEMKKYNHNLGNLYKDFPDLLEYLNIEEVSEFKNGFVWDYRIKLKNSKELLIKDVEAIRYGSFAKNRDVMTLCVDDDEIVNLLNKLDSYVKAKKMEVNNELMKYCVQ